MLIVKRGRQRSDQGERSNSQQRPRNIRREKLPWLWSTVPNADVDFPSTRRSCPECHFPNPLSLYPPDRGRALTKRGTQELQPAPEWDTDEEAGQWEPPTQLRDTGHRNPNTALRLSHSDPSPNEQGRRRSPPTRWYQSTTSITRRRVSSTGRRISGLASASRVVRAHCGDSRTGTPHRDDARRRQLGIRRPVLSPLECEKPAPMRAGPGSPAS